MANSSRSYRSEVSGSVALLVLAVIVTACGAIGKSPAADAIGYTIQTGLGGLSYNVRFLRSGEAKLSCSFYDLRDGLPRTNARSVCDKLWDQDRSRFRPEGNSLKADFSARFEPTEMAAMEKVLDDNGYYSMNEKYEFDGRLDAPPSYIDVETAGKKRSVPSNDAHQEAHTAIIQTLGVAASTLDWN
jgi:hypothetical protein